MKTAEQREKAFREDLKKILRKHDAEIELVPGDGYYEFRMMISMLTQQNDTGDLIGEFCEFEL